MWYNDLARRKRLGSRQKRGIDMAYDNKQVIEKLRQWESYSSGYRLPAWDEIPDMGLYMEQVTALLLEYLNLPRPEGGEDAAVTAPAINNYVRKRVMPGPINKKYYRRHIAYLIIIYTLKHCFSIPTLQILLPPDLTDEEMEREYTAYVARCRVAIQRFVMYTQWEQKKLVADGDESPCDSPEDLITTTAVLSGLARQLAEQLLRMNEPSESSKS